MSRAVLSDAFGSSIPSAVTGSFVAFSDEALLPLEEASEGKIGCQSETER